MPSSIRAGFISAVAAAICAASVSAPAQALDFDLLPQADMGPTSWAGWIINPDIGVESMTFSGTGGDLLKQADGYYAGGYVGRDFQWGPLVVGASANIAYSWMEGSGAGSDPFDIETRLNYFGLVRGRAGIGIGRFLVYGTGGLAYGDLEIESRDKQSLSVSIADRHRCRRGHRDWLERFNVFQSRIFENRFRRSDVLIVANWARYRRSGNGTVEIRVRPPVLSAIMRVLPLGLKTFEIARNDCRHSSRRLEA